MEPRELPRTGPGPRRPHVGGTVDDARRGARPLASSRLVVARPLSAIACPARPSHETKNVGHGSSGSVKRATRVAALGRAPCRRSGASRARGNRETCRRAGGRAARRPARVGTATRVAARGRRLRARVGQRVRDVGIKHRGIRRARRASDAAASGGPGGVAREPSYGAPGGKRGRVKLHVVRATGSRVSARSSFSRSWARSRGRSSRGGRGARWGTAGRATSGPQSSSNARSQASARAGTRGPSARGERSRSAPPPLAGAAAPRRCDPR